MAWLVTGGAGYIGAHVVRDLLRESLPVVVLDDESACPLEQVPDPAVRVHGSITDTKAVRRALEMSAPLDGVIHLAAKKLVGESVAEPLAYWHVNVEGLRTLLSEALPLGLQRLVFSPSAGVYGSPEPGPARLIDEDTLCRPVSPYGWTKLAGEALVDQVCRAHPELRAISLRYFNVAGTATPYLRDRSTTHLIPVAVRALLSGQIPQVHGSDYSTPDGTCIRDYIHVSDLSRAHLTAARWLADGDRPGHTVLNVGTGVGASVLEVVAALRAVSGIDFEPVMGARRPGDPDRLVADPARATRLLGFRAEHDLREVVASAWTAATTAD